MQELIKYDVETLKALFLKKDDLFDQIILGQVNEFLFKHIERSCTEKLELRSSNCYYYTNDDKECITALCIYNSDIAHLIEEKQEMSIGLIFLYHNRKLVFQISMEELYRDNIFDLMSERIENFFVSNFSIDEHPKRTVLNEYTKKSLS